MNLTTEELDAETIECLPAREVMSTWSRGGRKSHWGGGGGDSYHYSSDDDVNILNGANLFSGNNILNGNAVVVKL